MAEDALSAEKMNVHPGSMIYNILHKFIYVEL